LSGVQRYLKVGAMTMVLRRIIQEKIP